MSSHENNGRCRVTTKFWRASHKAWYCHVVHPDGRQQDRRLDPDEEKAENVRQKLIDEIAKTGRPNLDCTVDQLIQVFLKHVEDNKPKATLKWYKNFLKSFGEFVGKPLRVGDLKLHHVHNWLSKRYPQKGNQNTRHNAIACVKRLFNWATREMEYFDRNPVAGLKKPQRTHRDVCPTREQWEQVFALFDADDPFRLFLEALVATGCRPQELRRAEARQIDFPAGLIRFADGEICGKQYGRDVILSERAAAILKPLALAHPEGPIFRNSAGNPWKKDALNCRFQRLKKEKLPFRVNCYAARHSKATDLLENGASAGAVASILGHRDATVVLRFYGKHIDQRVDHLRSLMEKTDQPTKPPEPEPKKGKAKGGKKGKPEAQQKDGNPPGLRVIGKVPPPKPESNSKRRKRDAG
jgi:site-specific recombinase XerD